MSLDRAAELRRQLTESINNTTPVSHTSRMDNLRNDIAKAKDNAKQRTLEMDAGLSRSLGEATVDTAVPIVEAAADTVTYGVGGLGLLATADPTEGMQQFRKAAKAYMHHQDITGSSPYGMNFTAHVPHGYLTQNPNGMNRDGSQPMESDLPTHWADSDLRKWGQEKLLNAFGAYEDAKTGAKGALYSDTYKAQEALYTQQVAALKETKEYKTASAGDKFIMEMKATGEALVDNPLVATNTLVEAGGDIGMALTGGAIAKGIGKKVAKNQIKKAEKSALKKVADNKVKAEAEVTDLAYRGRNNNAQVFQDKLNKTREANSKISDDELALVKKQFLAQKKSIEESVGDKAAALLGFTGTTALQEGGSNAAGVIEKIDKMSHEKLLGSDIYAEAYLRTGDREKAKNELKGTVATDTFILSGATAAFISTVTGAGALATKTLTKDATSKIARKAFADKLPVKIGTEIGEEVAQGITGDVISNVNLLKADKDTKVFEGLGETTVMSAVGGAGGGVGVHGTSALSELFTAKDGTPKNTVLEGEALEKGIDKDTNRLLGRLNKQEQGLTKTLNKAENSYAENPTEASLQKLQNARKEMDNFQAKKPSPEELRELIAKDYEKKNQSILKAQEREKKEALRNEGNLRRNVMEMQARAEQDPTPHNIKVAAKAQKSLDKLHASLTKQGIEIPAEPVEDILAEPESSKAEPEEGNVVEEVVAEQAKKPTSNPKVKQLIEDVIGLEQGYKDNFSEENLAKQPLAQVMASVASFKYSADSIPSEIDTLLEEDLDDADRATLEKVKARYEDKSEDTFVGILQERMKNSPEVVAQVDSAISYLLDQGNVDKGNEFAKALKDAPEQAISLADSLVRVKLASMREGEGTPLTPQQMDTLSEIVTNPEVSAELNILSGLHGGLQTTHAEYTGLGGKDTRKGLLGFLRNMQDATKYEDPSARFEKGINDINYLLRVSLNKKGAIEEAIENRKPGETIEVKYVTGDKTTRTLKVTDATEEGLLPTVTHEIALAEKALVMAKEIMGETTQETTTPVETPTITAKQNEQKKATIAELIALPASKVGKLAGGTKLSALVQDMHKKGIPLSYSDVVSVVPASWSRDTILRKVYAARKDLKDALPFDSTNPANWTNEGSNTLPSFREQIADIDQTFPQTGNNRQSSDSFKDIWARALSVATKIISPKKVVTSTTRSGVKYPLEASRLTIIGEGAGNLNTGTYTADDIVLIAMHKETTASTLETEIQEQLQAVVDAKASIVLPESSSSTLAKNWYSKIKDQLAKKGYVPELVGGAHIWSLPSEPTATTDSGSSSPEVTTSTNFGFPHQGVALADLSTKQLQDVLYHEVPNWNELTPSQYNEYKEYLAPYFHRLDELGLTVDDLVEGTFDTPLPEISDEEMDAAKKRLTKPQEPEIVTGPAESFDDVFGSDGLLGTNELDKAVKVVAKLDQLNADIAALQNLPKLNKELKTRLDKKLAQRPKLQTEVEGLLETLTQEQLSQVKQFALPVSPRVTPPRKKVKQYALDFDAPVAEEAPTAEPKSILDNYLKVVPNVMQKLSDVAYSQDMSADVPLADTIVEEVQEEGFPLFEDWVNEAGTEAESEFNKLPLEDQVIITERFSGKAIDYLRRLKGNLTKEGKKLYAKFKEANQEFMEVKRTQDEDIAAIMQRYGNQIAEINKKSKEASSAAIDKAIKEANALAKAQGKKRGKKVDIEAIIADYADSAAVEVKALKQARALEIDARKQKTKDLRTTKLVLLDSANTAGEKILDKFGGLYQQAKTMFKILMSVSVETPTEYITNLALVLKDSGVLENTPLKDYLSSSETLKEHIDTMSPSDLLATYESILEAVDESGSSNLKRMVLERNIVPVGLNQKANALKQKLSLTLGKGKRKDLDGNSRFGQAIVGISDSPVWGGGLYKETLMTKPLREAFLQHTLGLKNTPANHKILHDMYGDMLKFVGQLGKFSKAMSADKLRESPLRDLMVEDKDGNWTFPQELHAAMYVAYTSTLASVGSSEGTPNWQLAQILGVSEDVLGTLDGVSKLQTIGTLLNADSFTSQVRGTLGIKLDPNVTADVGDGVYGALGNLFFQMAQKDIGLESKEVMVGNKTYKGFVALPKVGNKPTFLHTLKEGEDILSKLSGFTNPSQRNYIDEMPSKVDTSTSYLGNQGKYTPEAAEAENNARTIAWEFDESAAMFYLELEEEGFKKLHGYMEKEELDKLNVNLRDHYIGKNIQLVNSYRKFVEHYELVQESKKNGGKGHTYFASTNSAVRRAQMHGHFNPQNDKFHRALFRTVETAPMSKVSWGGKLKGFNPKKITTKDAFILGLGQALGLDADKQPNQKTYDETIEVILHALKYAKDLSYKFPEGYKYTAIIEAAANSNTETFAATMTGSDKEAFHTKQAIFALSSLMANTDENLISSEFKHSLRFEIDGVTNGPHHNNIILALGEAGINRAFMIAGGVLQGHDTAGIHHEIVKEGFQDNYQAAGVEANEVAREGQELLDYLDSEGKISAWDLNVAKANEFLKQQTITVGGNIANLSKGKTEGSDWFYFSKIRNLFKNPVTVTVYAGGQQGITNNLVAGVKDAYYTKLTEVAGELDKGGNEPVNATHWIWNDLKEWAIVLSPNHTEYAEEGKEHLTFLNMFADSDMRRTLKRGESVSAASLAKFLREVTLNPKQETTINSVVTNKFTGLGTIVNKAIKRGYQHNKNTASVVTGITNTITLLANNAYTEMYTKLQAKRVKQGKLREGEALSPADFAKVKAELNRLLPGVSTSFENDPSAITKQSKENKSLRGSTLSAQVPTGAYSTQGTPNTTSTDISGSHRDFSTLGVAIIPRLIISVDALMQAQNHILQGLNGDYLNVFDAIDKGADSNLQVSAAVANIADYIATMRANPLQAVMETFDAAIKNLNKKVLFDGDIVITPVLKQLEDSPQSKGKLSPEFNLFRQAVASESIPLHEYLGSFTEMKDPMKVLNFLRDQLGRMEHNTKLQKEHLWFQEDMTNSQMGGVDNGVARIRDGQIIITEELKQYLGENGIAHIEAFNIEMKEHYDAYKKQLGKGSIEDVLKEPNPIWDKIKTATVQELVGDEKAQVKGEVAYELDFGVSGFIESLYANGTPSDLTNMVFTFDKVEDRRALLDLLASEGIHLDERQKALLVNNRTHLEKLLKGLKVSIVDDTSGSLGVDDNGRYVAEPDEFGNITHNIFIREGLTAYQASKVFAHELSHMLIADEIISNTVSHVEGDATTATFKQHLTLLNQFTKLFEQAYKVDEDASELTPETLAGHNDPQSVVMRLALLAARAKTEYLRSPTDETKLAYSIALYEALQEHMAYGLTEDSKEGDLLGKLLADSQASLHRSFKDKLAKFWKDTAAALVEMYYNLIPNSFLNKKYGKAISVKPEYYSYNTISREVFVNYVIDNKGAKSTSNASKPISGLQLSSKRHIGTQAYLTAAMVDADTTGLSEEHKSKLAHTIQRIGNSIRTGTTYTEPGEVPFITDVYNSYKAGGIPLDGITGMVYEQLAQVLAAGSGNHWFSTNELFKVFNTAKEQLSPTDFIDPSVSESDVAYPAHLQIAENQYNAIFESAEKNAVTNFASLAETSEWFQGILSKVNLREPEDKIDTGNIVSDVHMKVNKAIRNTGESIANIPKSSNAYSKVRALNSNLLKAGKSIQKRKESKISQGERQIDDLLKKMSKTGVLAFTRLMKMIPPAAKLGGAIEDLFIDPEGKEGRAEEIRRNLIHTVFTEWLSKDGESMNTLVSFLAQYFPRSMPASIELDRLKDSGNYSLDNIRENQEGTAMEVLRSKFKHPLIKEQDKTLGTILRSDLGALLKVTDMDKLVELLNNPVLLESHIAQGISLVKQNQGSLPNTSISIAINEAKSLGYRTVTGGVYQGFNFPNAYKIAHHIKAPQLEETLDTIATLSAIKALDTATKENMVKLIESEPEGVKASIAMHKGIESNLAKANFHMIKMTLPKGYLQADPMGNSNLRIVPVSKAKKLKGYTAVRKVERAKSDIATEPLVLMVSDEGGHVPYVQGAISTIEATVGGTIVGNLSAKDKGLEWTNNYKRTLSITSRTKRQAYAEIGQGIIEPKLKTDGMLPIIDSLGNIVGYQYAITKAEYETQEDRDFSGMLPLAKYSARVQEEALAGKHNEKVVSLLKKAWDERTSAKQFVTISAKSKDPVHREIWRVMPSAVKEQAKLLFGEDELRVNKRDLDNALGYREMSVKNIWDYPADSTIRKFLVHTLENILGKNAINKLRTFERAEQEVVTVAKDIITIRSVVVPTTNILSNLNQLHVGGVDADYIVKQGTNSVTAVHTYKRDMRKYLALQTELSMESDPRRQKAYQVRLTQLNNKIQLNPVFPLIREGLLPSIIDELAKPEDGGGLRGQIVDKYISPSIQESVVGKAVKEVLITEDSGTHKALSEVMELGDFVAKYIRYSWLVEHDGLSHEEAVADVRNEFINYSNLTGRTQDYANKLGVIPFFKYHQGSQAIQLKHAMARPTRALLTMGGVGQFMPNIYDVSIFTKDFLGTTGTLDLIGMAEEAQFYLGK